MCVEGRRACDRREELLFFFFPAAAGAVLRRMFSGRSAPLLELKTPLIYMLYGNF